jgi:NAD dependent epimerase/dehydratase family enzyme
MASLRAVVGARVGLPAFRWMLEPAMWLLRTEPELVLKSRWVVPDRLESYRFEFTWPELEPALANVYGVKRKTFEEPLPRATSR